MLPVSGSYGDSPGGSPDPSQSNNSPMDRSYSDYQDYLNSDLGAGGSPPAPFPVADTGAPLPAVPCGQTLSRCRVEEVEHCGPACDPTAQLCRNTTRQVCSAVADIFCDPVLVTECRMEEFTEYDVVCSTKMELVQGNCSRKRCRMVPDVHSEISEKECKDRFIAQPTEETVEECVEQVERDCSPHMKIVDGFQFQASDRRFKGR